MANGGIDPWGVLLRLSTYAPPEAVIAAARGETPAPGRQALEGAVLVADLSGFTALSERLGRKGRDGIDELHGLLNRVFSTLLERAVFPWGGALVKYAGDALLAYFAGADPVPRALTAALAAQEDMERLSATLEHPLAVRVGVGAGAFDLVTVGRPEGRLDCFCAGDAAMRALAAVDEAGPRDVVLSGAGLPRGPFRAGSRVAVELAGHPVAPQPRPDSLGGVGRLDVRRAIEALRPFLAPELYERIAASPSAALPSERRNACAVFCEIEGWDGDVARLGEHYLVASEVAQRHGGMLNKIDAIPRGPRVLAAFGVPAAHGDDERRALAFALELRDRLRARVRVGVESGPLFAGEVGSVLKREFTVMGDSVNVAARLAHAAAPGQVLCGPDCWSRVDAFVGRPTAPLPLKGKSAPVAPIDVAAPRRFMATRLARRIGHLPLLGRERELARLDQVAARALAGDLQTLVLLGPPGSGKSALAYAAADRWLDAGGAAYAVRCEYDRRDQPYLILRTILAAWLELPLEPPPPAEAVRGALARLGIDDPVFAEQTGWVLDPGSPKGDPQSEAVVARLVTGRLARVVAGRAPLMVIVDDAQHADAGSAELLLFAQALEEPTRAFVLVLRRPGAELAGVRRMASLELPPLDRTAQRALLARALGAPAVSEMLDEAVDVRARGNPLFVRRLAGWMASRGLVERVGDRAALSLQAAEDPAGALPPDLESLVHAEIDPLPPAARAVLRTLSALGAEFPADLAEALCEGGGAGREDVREALTLLARAGLLMTTGGAAPRYRFARLSDREVIYSGLPAAERKGLHARVASALAERGAGDDRLALHYDLADDHLRAGRACGEVARAGLRRGAYADALRLFRAAARHLAATGGDLTDCQVGEVECLARLASYGEARTLALDLAERLPDPAARIRALTTAAMCASYQGDLAAARALMKRAKDEIPLEAPAPLRANLLLMCASYHAAVGQPLEAIDELAEARPLAPEDRAPVIVGLHAGILAEVGLADDAAALAAEAVALADQGSHKGNRAFTRVSLGRALEARAQREEAIARYREAQALYSEIGQLSNAANARLHAAQVELARGRPGAALTELEGALETFRHFASGQDETAARCSIGRARFLLGEREAAIEDLERAVAQSEATREHHAAICGRAWLAEALWGADRARARALLDDALRIGRERSMALELEVAQDVARRLGA